MPLLEISQARQISNTGGASCAQASYHDAAIVGAAECPGRKAPWWAGVAVRCVRQSDTRLEFDSKREQRCCAPEEL